MADVTNNEARDHWLIGVDPKTGKTIKGALGDTGLITTNMPIVDVRKGGIWGWSARQGSFVSSQPHTTRNLVCVVLQVPLMCKHVPGGDVIAGSIKSMMEVSARKISGINLGLELTTDSTPWGGDGNVFEVPTDAKITAPSLNITLDERYGMPFGRILDYWIRYFIIDPSTKFALVNTIPNVNVTDHLADQYSCSLLLYEPDPVNNYVNQAVILTNVFPKNRGENTLERDLTSPHRRVELSIPFSAIQISSLGVVHLAQLYHDSIRRTGADPQLQATLINDISSYVRSLTNSEGYKDTVERVAKDNIILHGRTGDSGTTDKEAAASARGAILGTVLGGLTGSPIGSAVGGALSGLAGTDLLSKI